MKRSIGLLLMWMVIGKGILANEDSLSCLKLSGKVSQKGTEQLKAYRVELRTGEELIRTLYSDKDESFTLLLKRNTQYALKVIANGTEMKRVFINTHVPLEEINKEHRFNPNVEFPDSECEHEIKKMRATGGTVSFDKRSGSFFYTCRTVEEEEEGSGSKKPK